MNKLIPHIKKPHLIALVAITCLIAVAATAAQAQTTDPLLDSSVDQSMFPQITAQPVDQTVPIGSSVTVSVQASNADIYQWLRNGIAVDGQTNTSLTIASAGIGDVGLYSCNVSLTGGGTVPTRAANVCVYTTGSSGIVTKSKLSAAATSSGVMQAGMPGGGPITVFGTPLLSNG